MLPIHAAILAFVLTMPAGPSIGGTSPLPTGVQGLAYSQAFTASGGAVPYQWSLSGGDLPPGVGLNADGSLAGTPTGSGTYNFSVKVTDIQGQSDTKTFAITVNSASAAPIIRTASPLVSGNVGATYSVAFTADGNNSPFTWTVAQATLPPGLSLDSNGNLRGMPTGSGKFAFTITLTDRVGTAINKDYTIDILPPPK